MTLLNLARRAALVLVATSAPAYAQTCGGFNDVSPADFYCNNVEWMKNRAITLGCGSNNYCPLDTVNRGAMAAFMNRLGKALTPQPMVVQATSGGINLDASPVVCTSPAVAADTFPRVMAGTWHLDAQSAGAMALQAKLMVSNDGGATWVDLSSPTPMRTQTDASAWTAVSGAGTYDIAVGESPRFALRIARQAGGGAAQISDSHCQLSLKVLNRNPASPPF